MLSNIHFFHGSRKIAPSPNSNANPKPNPDADLGAIFLGGNFPDTFFHMLFQNGTNQTDKHAKLTVYCLLPLGRPVPNSYFNIHNPVGLKLLFRLRVELSHLNDLKFKYNFSNCINPLSSCSLEVELTTHFFLHCLSFSSNRKILFNELISICKKFIDFPDPSKVELLLYGSPDLRFTQNTWIIKVSEYPFKENKNTLKKHTSAVIYTFL